MKDQPLHTRYPAVVDLVLLTLATGLALVGFNTIYLGGRHFFLGLAGFGLAAGVAAFGARRRWNWLPVTAAGLAVFVLGAAPVTLPATAYLGMLPTLDTMRQLYTGATEGWWGLLTTLPPILPVGELGVIPYLGGFLAGLVGAQTALRTRAIALPLLAPGLLLAVGILFGIAQPAAVLLHGAGFALLALVWVTLRHHRDQPPLITGSTRRSRALGAAGLVLAAVAAAAVAGFTPALAGPGDDRFVLREHVEPPFDASVYPSPLAGFRRYEVAQKDRVLFTVSNMPADTRIRLAVMDRYDGVVWNVAGGGSARGGRTAASGIFERVGAAIPTAETGRPATVTVTLRDLGGVWLPTVGYLTRTAFSGDNDAVLADAFRYNRTTGAGVLRTPIRLAAGDTFTFNAVVPVVPSAADIANQPVEGVTLPESVGVPDQVATEAIEWAEGGATPAATLTTLTQKLISGAFSDGTELDGVTGTAAWPGHSARRIRDFLSADQLVGDPEQYAATLALMARELGLPARVVLGAAPGRTWTKAAGPGGEVTSGEVTGSMITAWTEVRFAGVGWVAFDSTPPVTNKPKPPEPQRDPNGTTEVVQPSVAQVQPPAQQPPPGTGEEPLLEDTGACEVCAQAVWVLTYVVPPVLLIGGTVLALVLLKARRRIRRRRSGPPRARVAGGWREFADRAHDHQVVLPPRRPAASSSRCCTTSRTRCSP